MCLECIVWAIFICLPWCPFIFRYSSLVIPFTVAWLQLWIVSITLQIISWYIIFYDHHITTCQYRVFWMTTFNVPVIRLGQRCIKITRRPDWLRQHFQTDRRQHLTTQKLVFEVCFLLALKFLQQWVLRLWISGPWCHVWLGGD